MNYTIIGNGESRKSINISNIKHYTVGCNAIYLYEKNINLLCAMDKFWQKKICKETTIPLLSRFNNTQAQSCLQLFKQGSWMDTSTPYRGYCSGTTALDYIASKALQTDLIYLIGFDFFNYTDKVNHIYKNELFHPKADRAAQNQNIFLQECLQIFKRHPLLNFVWVNSEEIIEDWQVTESLTIEEYQESMTND